MARRLLPLLAVLSLPLLLPLSALAQEIALEPVVDGLGFASNVAFAPDGTAFVADKDVGQIRIVRDGRLLDEPFATLPVLVTVNETGLLGIAVHPEYPAEPWVYAYYTDQDLGASRLVRIRAEGDVGVEVDPLIDLVPVAGFHNGGDIAFGPDGALYVVTGDGTVPERAQDPDDPGGKVLRLNPDGTVPDDNPIPGSPVYALGIRNSFGICFDPVTEDLWETENGPDRFDEVNRIEAGRNYGWPDQLGPGGEPAYADPVLAFETVIVPTGCAVTADGTDLYFVTYPGTLHRLALPPSGSPRDELVAELPGPAADIARAPDGSMWVTTTNAIYRFETAGGAAGPTSSGSPVASPVATPEGSGSPAATPSPAAGSSGLSPGAIVVGLVIIGGLLLFRARMPRG